MKVTKRVKAWGLQQIARRLPWNLKVSYSQFGEDILIDFLTRGQNQGFYIDVGAFHPIALSNTYALYERGWRGINLDARVGAVNVFNAYRPRDINLGLAVSDACGRQPLYVFHRPEYTTLDAAVAKCLQQQGHILKATLEVPVTTLAQVCEQNLPAETTVDFLNIDVEGIDERVLHGNDWDRCRPRVIALERHALSLEDVCSDTSVEFLSNLGYEAVGKCGPTIVLTTK